MTETDVNINDILSNQQFRNVIHLLATLGLGFILLRLLLFILDTAHIGLGWLENHQDSAFVIIILTLVLSFLIADVAISRGRRYIGDQRDSVAETAISYLKSKIQRPVDTTEFVVEETSVSTQNIGDLSKLISTLEPKAPIPKPSPLKEPVPVKSIPKEQTKPSVSEPSGLEDLVMGNIENESTITPRPEVPEPAEESKTRPAKPLKPLIHPEPSQSIPAGQMVKEPELAFEPESNIVSTDTVPILVKEGKRVIKAFESEHSINVVDFRSKVTQKNVKITVELLKENSKRATPIDDKLVYEYLNIRIDLSNEFIENAVVRFNVKREWITKYKVRNIQLQQYINNNWAVIPTKRIGQDAKHLFYEAYVPSFSVPFAIVGT